MSTSKHHRKLEWSSYLAGALVVALATSHAQGCGPFFPNSLIVDGDAGIVKMPIGNFVDEMKLLLPENKTRFVSNIPIDKQGPFDQSAKIDEADLRAVLVASHTPGEQVEVLCKAYAEARAAVTAHAKALDDQFEKDENDHDKIAMAPVTVPAGLPGDFDDYVQGLVAFHQGDKPAAQAHWQHLLDKPAAERKERSVWAAYMLGKSYLDDDRDKARTWFGAARKLAGEGFADSLGLAASSYGWEARADLLDNRFAEAINLYLLQGQSGDPSAVWSLRVAARKAITAGGEPLVAVAKDASARDVITAYLLSDGGPFHSLNPMELKQANVWMEAMNATDAKQVHGADRLAWAAYRLGDYTSAQKWADLSADDLPVAQWVHAKLLLRAGKREAAAKLLSHLVQSFPVDTEWTQADELNTDGDHLESGTAASRVAPIVAGDLALLELSRGQYLESLDLLMKCDYWQDAAYIAERVLTVDELKKHVDAHYPPVPEIKQQDSSDRIERRSLDRPIQDLRHLLARRLTRAGRWKEARPYYPADLQPQLDAYISAIRAGHDKTRSQAERAGQLMEAARIAHDKGLELLGTELDPDYFIWGGQFADAAPGADSSRVKLTHPTDDETARYQANAPKEKRRFSYRYIATDLAWSAIQLMPDETDETAAALNEAGGWIKNRDPKAADRFYKALVHRCGTTAVGKQANAKHWFVDAPR